MIIRIDHDEWINTNNIASFSLETSEGTVNPGVFHVKFVYIVGNNTSKYTTLKSCIKDNAWDGMHLLRILLGKRISYEWDNNSEYFDLWNAAQSVSIPGLIIMHEREMRQRDKVRDEERVANGDVAEGEV